MLHGLARKSRRCADWPRISERGAPAAQEQGHLGLSERAPRNRQHGLGQIVLGCLEIVTVQSQKHERRHRADPLVSIEKGMLPDQVKR